LDNAKHSKKDEQKKMTYLSLLLTWCELVNPLILLHLCTVFMKLEFTMSNITIPTTSSTYLLLLLLLLWCSLLLLLLKILVGLPLHFMKLSELRLIVHLKWLDL
jgi:hypothetical protein